MQAVGRTELRGLPLIHRGKVRDIYEVDDAHLLLVATDRISAFDVVLPDPVPGKGIILTQLSLFWFQLLRGVTEHHVVASEIGDMPAPVRAHEATLRGRTLLVRKAEVFPAECIARGFLLGSGWKDYQRTGRVCGIELPPGLVKNHRFDPPLFTPSTKAKIGHDENISMAALRDLLGGATASKLSELTLRVFAAAAAHAEQRGVVICDTKLEWGRIDSRILLVDEVLTPDSSRFWREEEAKAALPKGDPPSYDKQVVRDWLEKQPWDKSAPGPRLPPEVIQTAMTRYREIYERIAGRPVPHLED